LEKKVGVHFASDMTNEIILPLMMIALGILFALGFGGFALISIREGERRAARVAFSIGLIGGLSILITANLPTTVLLIIATFISTIVVAGIVVLFLPIGKADMSRDIPNARCDEREIMFARARLIPGTGEYEAYYHSHPEHKLIDDRIRTNPGLLSPGSKYYDRNLFAAPLASFELTGSLRDAVNGEVSGEPVSIDPGQFTFYIKNLGIYFGALDVGITKLRPYHVYSHIGRGNGIYGDPIPVEHAYAIAFNVEMDYSMVGSNPTAPGVMESARQYVEAAKVGIQLASTIRQLGYEARAHIDGNYRVIAPLVARDAGLGEIGRMGLLMTPRLGPRVRLGVVTTNLPLTTDPPTRDNAIIDFCSICKKCALACPSKSIPLGGRQEIDGAMRWKIDAESCFHYWNIIGTDCGRCMTVCPYSHPDSFSHNVVRWGARKSGGFRRLVMAMDDLFYGKLPSPRPSPPWIRAVENDK
jgi:ferredoxin